MFTNVLKINPDNFRTKELKEACDILKNGGLVAFPTETVYGLGGDALNPDASSKIYKAKGRPSDNPLIVHIADMQGLYDVADDISENGKKLAKAFWPGPLTMVFKKKNIVPLSTTGGLYTVAVRMPGHAIARELILQSGVYIAAPSANISGRPSPTKAEHVIEDLDGRIDMIIDGGSVGIGIESTIVDVSCEETVILRPGYITKDMIEDVVGNVSIDAAIKGIPKKDILPKAPGMKYRHYAPKGQLFIVKGDDCMVAAKINRLVYEKENKGYKVAVIATDESIIDYKCNIVKSIGSRQHEDSIAARLYDVLREMDYLNVKYIYSESFGDDILGGAVMNRMLKAAAYNIINA